VKHLIFLSISALTLLTSCGDGNKKKTVLPIDVESIDFYVSEKLDTSQTYEIINGLRFSKEQESYTVSQFSQNDTVILLTEEIQTANTTIYRNLFFKDDLPVYVEEYKITINGYTEHYTQSKTYFNGAIVLKAFEKSASTEEELEAIPFIEITTTMKNFDFDRPKNAALQEGDYKMQFGEFLDLGLQAYLVLENPKSGYNVALLILKGDALIDMLYANPKMYKGKTIYVNHEFMFIGGMEQMVYKSGTIIE